MLSSVTLIKPGVNAAGWVAIESKSTGKVYFHRKEDNKTVWECPPAMAEALDRVRVIDVSTPVSVAGVDSVMSTTGTNADVNQKPEAPRKETTTEVEEILASIGNDTLQEEFSPYGEKPVIGAGQSESSLWKTSPKMAEDEFQEEQKTQGTLALQAALDTGDLDAIVLAVDAHTKVLHQRYPSEMARSPPAPTHEEQEEEAVVEGEDEGSMLNMASHSKQSIFQNNYEQMKVKLVKHQA